ncbi:hypothetical protein LX64_01965 [Chitinophaga skermanii]|uniref:Uncharacterized protein n=1 Tax=Chitinophaga skermanii TaxID=331697 RepID=A0A327QSA7_9BACT|nr:hypothetical protein [Chitinophaga skermanii]RAJ06838.1 hypothetical protein LX64_01965 [Chitinophaga skermanii]
MPTRKKGMFIAIASIFCLGAAYFGYNAFAKHQHQAELTEKGVKANAIVQAFDANAGTVTVSYSIKGKKFELVESVDTGYIQVKKGEQYELLYLPEHPEVAKINFFKPVYVYGFTVASTYPDYIKPDLSKNSVRFGYQIKDVTYERVQPIPSGVIIDTSLMYMVHFYTDQPAVGYLDLK